MPDSVYGSVFFMATGFHGYAFVEAAALHSIVVRYAGAPIATQHGFLFCFPLFYLEMSPFPSIFCTIMTAAFSLNGE